MAVQDVDEATFATAVVQRSAARPVVVDFWAAWCGPCRQLSPMLERYAAQHAGDVDVVKVDVDANQGLAAQFGVQGIPAVKAFRDGRVVAEFTGLQPEEQVARFFDALTPSKADRLVAAAAAQPPDERTATLEQALAVDPGHVGALTALARLRADAGDPEGARALLERAPHDDAVQRLAAELSVRGNRVDDAELDQLRRDAAADPGAALAYGRALAAAGRHEEAAEQLLAAVRHPQTREPARESLVELFTTLGPDHPVVARTRPALARALF